VLVLGGSTFVGRAVVDHALAAGFDVAVLNRGRTTGAEDLPDSVERVIADRRKNDTMVAALAHRTFEAVIDVSAFVQVAGGTDYAGLIDLLDGRVGRYVLVSSIMAYDQSSPPVDLGVARVWHERAAVNPEPPTTYGGFKAMAERTVLQRWAQTGFPGAVVRPAAIYGPRNNIFDMEAAMFVRLAAGRPVLLPHGGRVLASYGHVEDLCDGLLTVATHPAAIGRVWNITTDDVTTRDYVALLASIVGVDADVVPVPDAMLGDIDPPAWGHLFGASHHAVLDTTAARDELGLTPRFDLRSGHEDAWAWCQSSGLLDRARDGALVDPLWRATWDLDHEAAVAARIRGR
jgi:nucleoside-diphosphate-sugar epimerase